MKNKLQIFLTFFLLAILTWLAGIGASKTFDDYFGTKPSFDLFSKVESNTISETTTPKPSVSEGEFITGPIVAETGELCVFKLNDPKTRADWTVVRQIDKEPPAIFYIDTAGSALTFSSNVSAKYTIIAAVIEEGKPRILQHVCEYGLTPEPTPGPNPGPGPTPKPGPEPQPEPTTLSDWVRQNIPEAGKSQCSVLASCYESAALGIERGSIKSPEAAFSAIRTNTQTKIKLDIWKDFLDKLSEKINERFSGNRDIWELGAIFKEIADGLKTGVTVQAVPTNEKKPMVNQAYCPDPTGRACQIQQPQIIYGGRR